MNQKILHTPEGVRDIYGGECKRKQVLERRLQQVLASFGYQEIETPTFEYFDVFGSDVGTIPSKDLYKFFDREGNTLALRPDFTPSIARAASRYFPVSEKPVRLSYLGRTFVNHQEHRGRLKENTEIGAELIGESAVDADAEIIAMATSMLLASGLKEFQISIGNVGFYESLVEEARIDDQTKEKLRLLIHNHNPFGVEQLLSGFSMDPKIRTILTQLTSLNGADDMLDRAFALTEGLRARDAVLRLMEILKIVRIYGLQRHVSFDLGMLSAYTYYTGVIFRGYTYGSGDAVVKGGRYETLLGHFGKNAPSAGFVVVLGNLMNALQRQKIPIETGPELLTITYNAARREEAHRKAAALRAEGKCVELVPERESED